MEYGFGSGALYGVSSAANPTPVRFGVIQSAKVSFKSKNVPLYGTDQLPVTVGVGTMQVTGSAELAALQPRFWNDIMFGSISTPNTGQTIVLTGEAGTVPGTSTYTITVVQSATWVTDLGVIYASTGLPLTRVASVSAIGQYSVAAGVYTFFSGDASTAMKIAYTYTATSGETLTLANQAIGIATTYKTVLSLPYNGLDFVLTLNASVRESLDLATALEDFTKSSYTFSAFTDSSGTLGTVSFGEKI